MRIKLILNLNISQRHIVLLVLSCASGSRMWTGGKAERKEGKVHLPYVTRSLAILVLTVLVNVGM